jgi:uncharacterized membrane protein YcfT
MTSSTSQKPALTAPAACLLRSRMPELDTIRGIAVLLVLFFMASDSAMGFRVSRDFQSYLSQPLYPVGWA